jgi:8-oxo-dGTP pyrophosphatase MutT (NUDIX family)
MIHEKSCGVVIFKENGENREFLALHYPGGHWDFVKGHVEKGEDEKQTALRELAEETGITDVALIDGFRETMEYTYEWKGQMYHKDVVYFVGKTQTQSIKISHEHQNFKWLPFEKALEQFTFDNAKNILKKAQQFLNSRVQ